MVVLVTGKGECVLSGFDKPVNGYSCSGEPCEDHLYYSPASSQSRYLTGTKSRFTEQEAAKEMAISSSKD